MTLKDILEFGDVDCTVGIDLGGEIYEIESIEENDGTIVLTVYPGGEG